MPVRYSLAAALLALAAASIVPLAARAAQVRVNVGPSGTMTFAPRFVNINENDHIVWVVVSGAHTVTEGDSSLLSITGFNSGSVFAAGSNTAAFSVKFPTSATHRYYCQPHAPGMAGDIFVNTTAGNLKSDFRITEVLYTGDATTDLIEITNLGNAPGDLGRYRLAVNGVTGLTSAVSTNSVAVAAGASVVIHCTAGTNTATDLFLSGLGSLPDTTGTLALYVPNTVNTNLNDATQMIDFVKWGVTANALESVATGNGFWSSTAIPTVGAAGHAIAFCGTAGQYGPGLWGEVSGPTFGTFGGNCTTPTTATTWGRIKVLYH